MSNRVRLCVALVMTVTGCATTGSSGGAPRREAADYYPLAVGNQWTYQVKTALGEQQEAKVEIVSQQDGYFLDNRGGKLRVDAYGLRDELRYLLQEPIESDHAWKNTVSAQATERYKILSVGATCEVPAGTFQDCVTVSSTLRVDPQSELINDLTFVRGVGMVRMEVDLKRNGNRVRQHQLELKSFSLTPAPSSEVVK
ncbi:MAG: hypothetical protein M3Y59_25265 [Myxococcota bacterium]|nr:hypothetical protein [Myxococcota bacterium]